MDNYLDLIGLPKLTYEGPENFGAYGPPQRFQIRSDKQYNALGNITGCRLTDVWDYDEFDEDDPVEGVTDPNVMNGYWVGDIKKIFVHPEAEKDPNELTFEDFESLWESQSDYQLRLAEHKLQQAEEHDRMPNTLDAEPEYLLDGTMAYKFRWQLTARHLISDEQKAMARKIGRKVIERRIRLHFMATCQDYYTTNSIRTKVWEAPFAVNIWLIYHVTGKKTVI